ncbi:hypothetical protein BDQ17DRAFT_1336006 [Cyathus striatus]|nr:hypothetical protein BDQ17DRAFT_1336006 [Cyathus striatus]
MQGEWRNVNGKTKKACAIQMQPSIASFFQAKPSKFKTSGSLDAHQEEEELTDSDIMEIDPPSGPDTEKMNTSKPSAVSYAVEPQAIELLQTEEAAVPTFGNTESPITLTETYEDDFDSCTNTESDHNNRHIETLRRKYWNKSTVLSKNNAAQWMLDLEAVSHTGELPENKQGKGATHQSHFQITKVYSALQDWVKGEVPFDKGRYNGRLCAPKLRCYVNEFLFPSLKIQDTISLTTSVGWLKRLGFRMSCVKKGLPIVMKEMMLFALSQNSVMDKRSTIPYFTMKLVFMLMTLIATFGCEMDNHHFKVKAVDRLSMSLSLL